MAEYESYASIKYRHEYLLLLEVVDSSTDDASANSLNAVKLLGCSSFPNWNQMLAPYSRPCFVQVRYRYLLASLFG